MGGAPTNIIGLEHPFAPAEALSEGAGGRCMFATEAWGIRKGTYLVRVDRPLVRHPGTKEHHVAQTDIDTPLLLDSAALVSRLLEHDKN